MDALLWVAGILAGLLLPFLFLITLLYRVPIRMELDLTFGEKDWQDTITVSWGFVSVKVTHASQEDIAEILIRRRIIYSWAFRPEDKTKPHTPEEIAQHITPISQEGMAALVQTLRHPLESLVSVFWQQSRFDRVHGKISLGLGDPAATGLFYGYYWAGRFILESARIHVEIDPVFDRKILTGDLHVRMLLSHPLLILKGILRFVRTPAIWEFIAHHPQKKPGAAPV